MRAGARLCSGLHELRRKIPPGGKSEHPGLVSGPITVCLCSPIGLEGAQRSPPCPKDPGITRVLQAQPTNPAVI